MQENQMQQKACWKKMRPVLRTAVLLAAFGMIAAGISNGEMQLIYQKAIMICLECIGIG